MDKLRNVLNLKDKDEDDAKTSENEYPDDVSEVRSNP